MGVAVIVDPNVASVPDPETVPESGSEEPADPRGGVMLSRIVAVALPPPPAIGSGVQVTVEPLIEIEPDAVERETRDASMPRSNEIDPAVRLGPPAFVAVTTRS